MSRRSSKRSSGTLPLLGADALPGKFPSTRYQGSKGKLVDWLWACMAPLSFTRCLDLFGGTGAVSYRLKQGGKQVTYNDYLRFNAWIARGLIANDETTLDEATIEGLLAAQGEAEEIPTTIQEHFAGIYFREEENAWLDRTITRIHRLADPCKASLAFFALAQACLTKRPYNLFHRKNLYLREADVPRSFGNKTTWEKPFSVCFRAFASEANAAVFDNGHTHTVLHQDALAVSGTYELVYMDPPYISARGAKVDYHGFYHFLEGLIDYASWPQRIDFSSKHRRLLPVPSPWTDKKQIHEAFARLFARHRDSHLVVSYRDDGIPSIEELRAMLAVHKAHVRVESFGRYQYALSTNTRSKEVLLIATDA